MYQPRGPRGDGPDPAEVDRLQRISDMLGETIHTAFRKAIDHPKAWEAWKAIDNLPTDQWSALLDWIRECLGLPPGPSESDPDDCPRVDPASRLAGEIVDPT